jgi:hypothetical protein
LIQKALASELSLDLEIKCLTTSKPKGKVLISIFPENLLVIDFHGTCTKNISILDDSDRLIFRVLMP